MTQANVDLRQMAAKPLAQQVCKTTAACGHKNKAEAIWLHGCFIASSLVRCMPQPTGILQECSHASATPPGIPSQATKTRSSRSCPQRMEATAVVLSSQTVKALPEESRTCHRKCSWCPKEAGQGKSWQGKGWCEGVLNSESTTVLQCCT